MYESTPNSAGYYHVNQTYWANGVPNQLSNLPSLPTITQGLDGEGRVNAVTASTGQNPVTGVTYNNASTVTSVNLGSGDSDSFTFDPNTLRMTQYKFTVGTTPQSLIGNLTWNANATLSQMSITDPFNSADAQTCNFAHDDLTRLVTASCGSAAAQTFSYDPFGNIDKSGSPYSFFPIYSTATNRMTSLSGFAPTYDANGNLTNDSIHSYSWDAYGGAASVDGVNAVYDALGRRVEQDQSFGATEIVYAPTGGKLALMSGQTLQKAFVGLPGQATAVYTISGLDHYRHPDWLGSARLTSSPSQTVLFTGAYAPFGEPYAQSGTADLSFTGQNQDTASGIYDFPAREYSMQGRWPSPDPSGLSAVDPSNPQSWNRYAYVLNNPMALFDPTGLCNTSKPKGNGIQNSPYDPCAVEITSTNTPDVEFGYLTIPVVYGSDSFTYTNPATGNQTSYTLGVDDGNAVWNGSNGDEVFAGSDSAMEIGAPNAFVSIGLLVVQPPSGPSRDTEIAKNHGDLRRYHCAGPFGPCTKGPPPDKSIQFGKWAKWYLCGNSYTDNIKNYTLEGTGKGIIVGGIAGGSVGGPAGAVAGAGDGALEGFIYGFLVGLGASGICQGAGVYGH